LDVPRTVEQLRAVDLQGIDHDVGVRVRRHREVPLSDLAADLGPGDALLMQERDPAVAQVVWGEDRHARIPACPGDRGAQPVRCHRTKERRSRVAILPGG
jgi:hypothetical protein